MVLRQLRGLRFLMDGSCGCVFALEKPSGTAETAGGEEDNCTIALLGNYHEGRRRSVFRERGGFVTLGDFTVALVCF